MQHLTLSRKLRTASSNPGAEKAARRPLERSNAVKSSSYAGPVAKQSATRLSTRSSRLLTTNSSRAKALEANRKQALEEAVGIFGELFRSKARAELDKCKQVDGPELMQVWKSLFLEKARMNCDSDGLKTVADTFIGYELYQPDEAKKFILRNMNNTFGRHGTHGTDGEIFLNRKSGVYGPEARRTFLKAFSDSKTLCFGDRAEAKWDQLFAEQAGKQAKPAPASVDVAPISVPGPDARSNSVAQGDQSEPDDDADVSAVEIDGKILVETTSVETSVGKDFFVAVQADQAPIGDAVSPQPADPWLGVPPPSDTPPPHRGASPPPSDDPLPPPQVGSGLSAAPFAPPPRPEVSRKVARPFMTPPNGPVEVIYPGTNASPSYDPPPLPKAREKLSRFDRLKQMLRDPSGLKRHSEKEGLLRSMAAKKMYFTAHRLFGRAIGQLAEFSIPPGPISKSRTRQFLINQFKYKLALNVDSKTLDVEMSNKKLRSSNEVDLIHHIESRLDSLSLGAETGATMSSGEQFVSDLIAMGYDERAVWNWLRSTSAETPTIADLAKTPGTLDVFEQTVMLHHLTLKNIGVDDWKIGDNVDLAQLRTRYSIKPVVNVAPAPV